MKKYIAPLVHISDLVETENLLLSASDPDANVSAATPDGNIPVKGGGSGGYTPPKGNVDYSKGYDSWTLWDE